MKQPELIQKLDLTLQFCLGNEHSSFYRDLFKTVELPNQITSLLDWQRVPLLTKQDLLNTPYYKRLFCPASEVGHIRCTSGTTGGDVLVIPRTIGGQLPCAHSSYPKPNGVLHSFGPLHAGINSRDELKLECPFIQLDFANLEASVRVAAQLGVDQIVCHTFLMPRLFQLLDKAGMSKRITVLWICGELTNAAQISLLQKQFPNARVETIYNSAEFQQASSKAPLNTTEPNTLSPHENFYWELIDENGLVIEDVNRPGELVLTHIDVTSVPMPLIRYRTGDVFERLNSHEEYDKCDFQVHGRVTLDQVKIPGGLLTTHLTQRALQKLKGTVSDDFQIHYYEQSPTNPLPRVVLKIKTTDADSMTGLSESSLAQTIAAELQLGPHKTFAEHVASGDIAPLSVEFVADFPDTGKKQERLIVHH